MVNIKLHIKNFFWRNRGIISTYRIESARFSFGGRKMEVFPRMNFALWESSLPMIYFRAGRVCSLERSLGYKLPFDVFILLSTGGVKAPRSVFVPRRWKTASLFSFLCWIYYNFFWIFISFFTAEGLVVIHICAYLYAFAFNLLSLCDSENLFCFSVLQRFVLPKHICIVSLLYKVSRRFVCL